MLLLASTGIFLFFLLLFSEAFPSRKLTARGTLPESFGPRVNSPRRRFVVSTFRDFLLIIESETIRQCPVVDR